MNYDLDIEYIDLLIKRATDINDVDAINRLVKKKFVLSDQKSNLENYVPVIPTYNDNGGTSPLASIGHGQS